MTKKHIKSIFLILIFLAGILSVAIAHRLDQRRHPIVINEVCQKSFTILPLEEKTYYPRIYVELFNTSDTDMDISGYSIRVPHGKQHDNIIDEYVIKAHSYALLAADEEDEALVHEGVYVIPRDANSVALYDAAGEEIDRVDFPDMPKNISYSRTSDGAYEFDTMDPTPYAPNSIGSHIDVPMKPAPVLSAQSGFIDRDFLLTIKSADPGDTIYYTLDGSDPDQSSILYEGPISIGDASYNENRWCLKTEMSAGPFYLPPEPIDKATILKAVSYDRHGRMSGIASGVYFVNGRSDMADKYCSDLPVLSVVSDPDNIWGYENGIMVLGRIFDDYYSGKGENYPEGESIPTHAPANAKDHLIQANFSYKGRMWERPVTLDYFEKGQHIFSKQAGIRSRGRSSSVGPQKSFSFFCRDMYDGIKGLPVDIFHRGYTEKKIVIKKKNCLLHDCLIMECISPENLAPLRYQPVNVFLNGEYWGLYCILEKYDDDFFLHNYGVPKGSVTLLKNIDVEMGDPGGLKEYQEVMEYAAATDMSVQENFDHLSSLVDMESLMDYYAMMIYVDAQDATDLFNVEMWKSSEVIPGHRWADGRWHYIPYDLDSTFHDYKKNNITEEIREGRKQFFEHVILKAALANEGFRKEFLKRLIHTADEYFAADVMISKLEEKEKIYTPSMILNEMRFQGVDEAAAAATVAEEFEWIRTFFRNRREYVMKYYEEYFGSQLMEEAQR